MVTSNFDVACSVCSDITVTFSVAVVRFGMVVVTGDVDDLTLTVFSGASDLGSLTYATSVDRIFVGIEELSGFDRVVIDANGSGSGAFITDLFRIDLRTDASEPATLALLGAGLLGLAGCRPRQRAR